MAALGKPAAVVTDSVMGQCMHTYQSMSPSPGGPVPTPVPMNLPFVGKIIGPGAATVLICGKPASLLGDNVVNTAIHPPVGGASIPGPAIPPTTNKATIVLQCSMTVLICNKPAVVMGSQTTPECGLAPGGGPAKVIASAMTVQIG
jgi:uncharacterized Zn-binding protein involved in type VI secretion